MAESFNAPQVKDPATAALLQAILGSPTPQVATAQHTEGEAITANVLGAMLAGLNPELHAERSARREESAARTGQQAYQQARQERADTIQALTLIRDMDRQAQGDEMERRRLAVTEGNYNLSLEGQKDKESTQAADLSSFLSEVPAFEQQFTAYGESAAQGETSDRPEVRLAAKILGAETTASAAYLMSLRAQMERGEKPSFQERQHFRQRMDKLRATAQSYMTQTGMGARQESGAEAAMARSLAMLGAQHPIGTPPPGWQRLPANVVGQLGESKFLGDAIVTAHAKWVALGKPGGWPALLGPVTQAQREWRAALQQFTTIIRNRLFGAALSAQEMASAEGLLANVDSLADTTEFSLRSLYEMFRGGYGKTVDEFKASGYWTENNVWTVKPFGTTKGVNSRRPAGARSVGKTQ